MGQNAGSNDLEGYSPLSDVTDKAYQRTSYRRYQLTLSCVRPTSKKFILAFAALVVTSLCLITALLEKIHRSASHELNAQKKWVWKNFPRHNGLIRGNEEFARDCNWDEFCENKHPPRIRYDGLRHFAENASEIVSCIGPRGKFLNESDADAVWAFEGSPRGAADPVLGSYNASGLDGSVSFDRTGRFRAYGIEQFAKLDFEDVMPSEKVNWDQVKWGELQNACVVANHHRFRPASRHEGTPFQTTYLEHTDSNTATAPEDSTSYTANRTAILLRVWTGATWSADAVLNLRALISEASLASGGKYQVFILLHVKDESIPIFVSENKLRQVIADNIPAEFHSITEVWNHAQIRTLYSDLADHAFVGRSPWMIVQWFARNHREFDFFYQWEFDVRYTGHYLDFFESIDRFSRQQPRKGIWERSGRVYIPSVHGRFESRYRDGVHSQVPEHVWGPTAADGVDPRGPKPPTSEAEDNFEWGVGEDADWVGFLPGFNVTGTKWWFKDYVWGYRDASSVPRRATLIAHGRVSRRVLDVMNDENAELGHHVDAEMMPQTMCLHHGLKATSFPHPIYADRTWPATSLDHIFNPGPFGQSGGVLTSTFSKWNEYAWQNMTWYYNSALAKPSYQQFMGMSKLDHAGPLWELIYGRAVIRPMLLHPVKGAMSTNWTRNGWIEAKQEPIGPGQVG